MQDLDLLCQATGQAMEIAMRYFGQSPEVWEKTGGQGPVSEADLEIDRMLRTELLAARPDYGWLSEETDDDPARLNAETVFIVDPIDGTRSFINRHENFGISVAIAHKGQVTHGVVGMPAKDMLYAAQKGQGARKNGQPIRAGSCSDIAQARVLASGAHVAPDLWRSGPPPFERHFRSSLAYRMCLVAEGRFDAMLTLRPTWEWDVAAGDIICSEAGAVVTDQLGQHASYNSQAACHRGKIAAPPELHRAVMGYL